VHDMPLYKALYFNSFTNNWFNLFSLAFNFFNSLTIIEVLLFLPINSLNDSLFIGSRLSKFFIYPELF